MLVPFLFFSIIRRPSIQGTQKGTIIFVGVLIIRAVLLGVYIRAPDLWKLPDGFYTVTKDILSSVGPKDRR